MDETAWIAIVLTIVFISVPALALAVGGALAFAFHLKAVKKDRERVEKSHFTGL